MLLIHLFVAFRSGRKTVFYVNKPVSLQHSGKCVWHKNLNANRMKHFLTSNDCVLRRERETLLVERKDALAEFEEEKAQLLSQLQDLEDQLQEKGRQLQETEEQVRIVWAV